MGEKIVGEFKKNTREVVRAVIKTWNGRELIDLRVYYRSADGRLCPGPKGLCLQSDKLPELQSVVNKLTENLLSPGGLHENP